jgi:hypothetical protein
VNRESADFLGAFEKLGYARIGAVRRDEEGSSWYELPQGESGVRHFALLSFKPRYSAYVVRAGFDYREARARLESATAIVKSFLPGAARSLMLDAVSRPCWNTFPVGRALDWKLFMIPDPLQRSNWNSQFEAMRELLETSFWSVDSVSRCLEAFVSGQIPFEWAQTQNVLRAANIVALGKVAGRTNEEIRTMLRRHKKFIVAAIDREKRFERLIEEFLHSI